jgi:RecB family exonuclease
MESFLDRLAGELLQKYGTDLSSRAVVFPTRRASLFFRRSLGRRSDRPVMAPALFSIRDFICSFIRKEIPDELTLLTLLFRVYSRHLPGESFGDFLPWGRVLLEDFDEADRQLVDIRSFFRTISDVKEMDLHFGLAEEDEQRVKDFWQTFYERKQDPLKENFYRTWEHLEAIYREFGGALDERNWAYEGKAYRHLAEQVAAEGWPLPYTGVDVAGLYALSRAEEVLLDHLRKSGGAELYWDADTYYADQPQQEAGTFFRKNSLIRGDYRWKSDQLASAPMQVTAVGIPLQAGQARSAGQILDRLVREEGVDPQRTAVILPDERMLFPMLYALPASVGAVNVTMGFPLRESPVMHLAESLYRLQDSYREGRPGSFYHRHVADVLAHPYVQLAAPGFCRDWLKEYKTKKPVRIPADTLSGNGAPALAACLFTVIGPGDWCRYLKDIFRLLMESLRGEEGQQHLMEAEFLFQVYTQLNRLEEQLPLTGEDVTHETFWYLFRQYTAGVRIPFTGEPLAGLQVMGLLESRLLDFDTLIFLSMNEDILPAGQGQVSLVPYAIRKAFGLPTYEDRHAVSSYHFFRLLQRASRVYLLYNSEPGGLSSGECSRLISQIRYELVPASSGAVQFREERMLTDIHVRKPEAIVIPKDADVLASLDRYRVQGPATPFSPKFSPSAISSYVQCPLKFYFAYVARLKEPEEVEDEMDARVFGSVLHQAMQDLYQEGNRYSPEQLELLAKESGAAVDRAIRTVYGTDAGSLEGKNIVLRGVLAHLVAGILGQDIRRAPFTILELEKNLVQSFEAAPGLVVHVGGVIDRVDGFHDDVCIVDYKTGGVELRAPAALPDLFSDVRHKEQLQTYFYAWMYRRERSPGAIRAGLYLARKLQDGLHYVNRGAAIPEEQLAEFGEELSAWVKRVYDPSVPFVQTTDEKQCAYCAFREICSR